MKYLIWLVIAAGFLGYFVKGCQKKPESSLPVVRMQIGGEGFNIEIATSERDQRIGLMHREHLDADHGMIFPMPEDKVATYWNHDVHFPLDVIFLDDKQDIVSIVRLEAYNEQGKSSGEPAEYAVELNAGTAARLKLKVGDHLEVPKEARVQHGN